MNEDALTAGAAPGKPAPTIAIIAGRASEAAAYARAFKLKRGTWFYVFEAERLSGCHSGLTVVRTGTYYARADLGQIDEMLRQCAVVPAPAGV